MHKLMICIEPLSESYLFDEGWPQFLHLAEQMPALLKESHSRVEKVLYGKAQLHIVHELFFETRQDLENAMTSPQGQAAGQVLQRITKGQMSLLFAEHKEDQIDHLRQYKTDDANAG
jgi:hypothetical protein